MSIRPPAQLSSSSDFLYSFHGLPRKVYAITNINQSSNVEGGTRGSFIPIHLLRRGNFTCCLTVKETTLITGEHQAILPLHADMKGVDFDGTSEKFACRHGLLIAHSISSTHRGSTLAEALNPSPTPVTL